MKPVSSISELRQALLELKPVWIWALILSWVIGLFGFTSTVYMLEVYDRVVNSRDVTTLLMLTLVTLGAYAVMEVIEKLRTRLLWGAGIEFELRLSDRIYNAMFDGLLKQQASGLMTVQNDIRTVREFFHNPAVGAMLELPIGVVSAALIFAINPMLGWAAIFGAAAQTFVAWLIQRTSREPLMEAQRRSQDAQTYAEASLRNAQVMESMGMLESVIGQWQKSSAPFCHTRPAPPSRQEGSMRCPSCCSN
jgi:ATP-binding cassette subfamily C exporter for protease/lipase